MSPEEIRLARIEDSLKGLRVSVTSIAGTVELLWNAHQAGGLKVRGPVDTRLAGRHKVAILIAFILSLSAMATALIGL